MKKIKRRAFALLFISFISMILLRSACEAVLCHEIPASGSGKRRERYSICTPKPAILSARRTKLDKICTPPVIQQAILHLLSSSHRTRFPNLAPYGARLDISVFSLTPCTAHSLFGATEKRMGGAFFAAKPHVAPYSSCLVIWMCSSSSCFWVTSEGALIITS